MIEPKLLKIEAVDEPEASVVQKVVETSPKPAVRIPFRTFFRRQKPVTPSARPADAAQV